MGVPGNGGGAGTGGNGGNANGSAPAVAPAVSGNGGGGGNGTSWAPVVVLGPAGAASGNHVGAAAGAAANGPTHSTQVCCGAPPPADCALSVPTWYTLTHLLVCSAHLLVCSLTEVAPPLLPLVSLPPSDRSPQPTLNTQPHPVMLSGDESA
eukprot:6162109-Prymnesium_polylepis.1